MRVLIEWFLTPQKAGARWWQVIAWWELRRIPYNILVGSWGLASLLIYFFALQGSGHLQPGP